MKHKILLISALLLFTLGGWARQNDLIILHTNDTHSHIDAENGVGGVLQRKALIDSVRRAEKNVVLVDAGDVVQGSLYFKLFGGAVEYPLMNMMGYDIQILGNHEFDNGLQQLAKNYASLKADRLSANYIVDNTPLNGLLKPSVVKKIGGKRVGFIGINVQPAGIISKDNYAGLTYVDAVEAANKEAARLRNDEKCDIVVAVSHIGYDDEPAPNDVELARLSRGIDVIIGGHSHTLIDPTASDSPAYRIANLDGQEVLVAQTGRYGANLGLIRIPLSSPSEAVSQLIPVVGVDSSKFDKRIANFIAPYRQAVDSVNNRAVAMAVRQMKNTKKYVTSVPLSNWVADYAQWYGSLVLDSIAANDSPLPRRTDLAIMNSGGVRLPVEPGVVTEGQVLSMFPFPNKMVVIEMTGEKLMRLIEQAVEQGGQAFSSEVKVAVNPDSSVRSVTIDGNPIDPARRYYVSTIDYLADGGDYLSLFGEGKRIWTDTIDMCAPVMRYVVMNSSLGIPMDGSPESRIIDAVDVPEGK